MLRVKVGVRAGAAGLGRTRGPARVERPAEEGLVRHGQTDGRRQFAPERAAGRYAVRHHHSEGAAWVGHAHRRAGGRAEGHLDRDALALHAHALRHRYALGHLRRLGGQAEGGAGRVEAEGEGQEFGLRVRVEGLG